MIDLEKLRPVLEPLGLDAAAIESIVAMDVPMTDQSGEIEKLQADMAALDASWNERFKKTFFNPAEGDPTGGHDIEVKDQVTIQANDTEPETFDDLFKEV